MNRWKLNFICWPFFFAWSRSMENCSKTYIWFHFLLLLLLLCIHTLLSQCNTKNILLRSFSEIFEIIVTHSISFFKMNTIPLFLSSLTLSPGLNSYPFSLPNILVLTVTKESHFHLGLVPGDGKHAVTVNISPCFLERLHKKSITVWNGVWKPLELYWLLPK